MNEIPQNMALQCPSLTLYAFHLRNSINQGLQPTVSAAPRLWEQLVDLGKALHIRELQILRQKLICYEGNRYFPEAEDFWGAEYLTLLENNEPSLHFQVPPQAGGLELQGLLCPFRLHDTYAIDLTLFSQDTEFLRHVGNKLQRQIQVDRDYLGMGRDRLQRLKATVWESITTEPIASEPWSGQGSGEQECKSALALQKELHYYGNNTLKSKMPGIPREISPRLRQALSDCAQFQSHDRLFNFFDANELLKPWRDDLPEVNNRADRAERVIGFLVNEKRSDSQENVLLILLRLLKDQIDPIRPLHQTLSDLLQKLATVLSDSQTYSNVVSFSQKNHTNLEILSKAELALEANPKGEPIRFIVADEKLLNCARAVARVSVTQIVSGSMNKIPTGTGWLVTQNLALTCWHVIEARDPRKDSLIRASDLQKQITNSTFTFDFTQPGEGIEYGIERLEHEDVNLDYALLRLRDRPDSPLKKWGFLKLDADVPLTLQTQLYVIQHPKGQPQQHSSGFFVKEASNTKILHNAPTEPGTSGAPVLNVTNFRVVALHNGENEAEKLREATTIKAILADLKQHRPELYDEIVAVQNPNQE